MRYLYCYNSPGGPAHIHNQLPAAIEWNGGVEVPNIRGADDVTLVIRSHGGNNGTIGGVDALTFARQKYGLMSLGQRGRVHRVILLVCHAGVAVNHGFGDGFPANVGVWGPNEVLSNAGADMESGVHGRISIRNSVVNPEGYLTADRGWSFRPY